MTRQPGSCTALIAGTIFGLFGVLGVIGSWAAYWLDTDIERSGARATGYIIGKSVAFSADGDSDFLVKYWFDLPGGKRVESERGISEKRWRDLSEGETLVVAYSAENPKRNFPLGGGVTSCKIALFVSAVSAALAAFGVILVTAAVRRSSNAPLP